MRLRGRTARRRRRSVRPFATTSCEVLELKRLLSAESGAPVSPTITEVLEQSSSVTVTWTPSPTAASYDVWVDDTVSGEEQVLRITEHSGTSLTVTLGRGRRGSGDGELAEGYYRIWVRASNEAGHSAWCLPEDFKLGDPPPLNPPASPTVLGPSGNDVSVRPTITWSAVEDADTYELWVDNRTTHEQHVIAAADLTGTSFDVTSALAAGTYRVWVRAANEAGNSAWSQPGDFTVPLAADPPVQPTITSVDEGTSSVDVSWTPSATADSYDVWVDNRVTGEKQVFRNTEWLESSMRFDVGRGGRGSNDGTLEAGYYRIWVRATNTAGHSTWSAAEEFTLGDPPPLNPPASPTVLGPTGNDVPVRPTITWSTVEHATTYELWVDHLSNDQTRVIGHSGLTGTSFDVTSALAAGTYRVWVRASNEAGNSAWSQPGDFTVPLAAAPPARPTITDVNEETSAVTVEWTPSASADSYDIWIDDLDTGEQQVMRITEHLDSAIRITIRRGGRGDNDGTLSEGNYRIWIRATNTAGHSSWSLSADFGLFS